VGIGKDRVVALTSHAQLRQWLIQALGERGGSAPRGTALSEIEARFGASLTPDDLTSPASRPWEPKWANRVSWERDRMVKDGILAPFVGHGTPWSLTEEGWRIYRNLDAPPSPTATADPFAAFKPKDSSDYQARVQARVFTKRRSHEALVARFGEWCISCGFAVTTAVHPIDLVVHTAQAKWFVEAKVLYHGNATAAVRAALAQVLMYAHFLGNTPRPKRLALFSEPIGDAYVDFLEVHGVASVWAVDRHWRASTSAARFRSSR
jgi:hypothetical protein